MATALKLRRGTTAQHATFTGAEGEVTVDTTKDTLVLHDGALAGGYPIAAPHVAQTFSKSQRGTITTDNDLSFDLTATNNFKCTPTGSGTLTFTNIASAAGQSGFVLLVNGSNYTISAAATTKVSNTALSTISATGTYLLSYFCDGTNVYIVNSAALA